MGDEQDRHEQNPLSSEQLRHTPRRRVSSAGPGPMITRPLGLRFAVPRQPSARVVASYSHALQVAVNDAGQPLIEAMGKEWKSKADSDGDEGPEEDLWDWEEQ
jgi:putative ATP-grasp target RiPP